MGAEMCRSRRAWWQPRKAATLAGVMAVALVVGACSSSDDGASEEASGADNVASKSELLPEAEGNTEYPVTIQTQYGDVEIEERPERVAAVDASGVAVDLVVSLGVTPVVANDPQYAVEQALDGEIESTITGGQVLEEIEKIASADPDIIISTGSVGEFYDRLADIAPVLVVDADTQLDQAWAPQLDDIGTALDLQDAAENVKDESRQHFADFREEHPNIQGLTVSYLVQFQDGRLMYQAARTATTDTFLEQLGFERSPIDPGLLEENFLSLENLNLIDADFIILTNHGAASESDLEQVTGSPLWNNLKAVQDGNWVQFGTTPDGYQFDGTTHDGNLAYGMAWPGPLNEMWAADQMGPILDSAA